MATTEDTRRELFEAARDNLGQPAAEALMAVTIPANADLVTRQDLELLRAQLLADRAALRGELAVLHHELATDRAETTAELAKHRAETTAELAKLTTGIEKLRSELYRWFLPAVAVVVGVVGYVTG